MEAGSVKACAMAPAARGWKPPLARAAEDRLLLGSSPPCSTVALLLAEARVTGTDQGAFAHEAGSNEGFSAHTPMGLCAPTREASPAADSESSPYKRRHTTGAVKLA